MKSNRFLIRFPDLKFISVVALLFIGITIQSAFSNDQGQTFVMHFDKPSSEEVQKNISVELHGGKIIPDGVSGHALRLNQGEQLILNLADKISSKEGTVMLWVRPHWKVSPSSSHTYLSFTWPGEEKGYFTISTGWWEPDGAQRTYFILNNQDHAHVSKVIDYEGSSWTHLACTWKSGNPGYLRLYVNGFKSAEGRYIASDLRHPSSKIYIGSDAGSPLAKGRWADSDIDELSIFNKLLTDEEIFEIFRKQSHVISPIQVKNSTKVPETRVILDEGIGWTTESGARETIKRIKRAGFNVYIPCVWHGMGTRYPSNKAPAEKGFTILPTDPLNRLIAIAHANNIEVHPWFCVALRRREFLQEFYGPETPKDAFDLHRPDFRSFIVNVMVDVVKRYNVDGINLDFIRTMGMCTCEFCRQEYHKITGRNLLLDYVVDRTRSLRNIALRTELQKWQDDAVEDIVRQVNEKAKAIKPNLIISVDGHPLLKPSPQGREEVRWANAGLIDIIFNMDYQKVPDFDNFQAIRHRLKDPSKLVMLLGNYDKKETSVGPTDANHLAHVVEYLQGRWPGRVGIYLYNQLSDAQIEALAQGPFQRPAKPAWPSIN